MKKFTSQKMISVPTETPGTVDIVFMGSSHVGNAFYPMELYQAHGFTSINLWRKIQTLPLSYYAIKGTIEQLQPKLIVLDLYLLFSPRTVWSSAHAHRTIDHFPLSLKMKCVMDLMPKEDWLEFLLPITLYHNRWWELTQDDFISSFAITKGSAQFFTTEDAIHSREYHPIDKSEKKEPPALSLQYLKRIIELCRETNTDLLLVTAPYCAWGMYGKRDMADEQRYYHWMRDYADQQGLTFLNMLDYLDEMTFDMRNDMRDLGHLNYWGGKKATLFLGAYLQDHYGELLHDRRGKAGYESWEKNVEAYNAYITDELNSPHHADEN